MLAGQLIRVTHFKEADITGNNVVKYKSNQDKTVKFNEENSQNVYVKLIASEQCGNAECVQLSSNSHKIRLKKCLLWILHQICISWARSHLTQLTPTQTRLPHSASCAASKTCSSSIRRHLTLRGMFSYDAYVLVYHLRNG